MVNEKKVRLMTQLALDEKRFYKDELDESGYFRSDYIRSNTLKVLLGYSISYLLIMGLVAMYYVDYLFYKCSADGYAEHGVAGRMYICRIIIDHYVVLCVVLYDQIYKQSQAFAQIYDGNR